jgi:hypothetical protein
MRPLTEDKVKGLRSIAGYVNGVCHLAAPHGGEDLLNKTGIAIHGRQFSYTPIDLSFPAVSLKIIIVAMPEDMKKVGER